MTVAPPLQAPWIRPASLPARAAAVVLGSVLVALCARIEIPLPFTPVPVTGQTFAVVLVGMALGARSGALSLLLYLAEGAAGLPVFSGGGAGVGHLFGPTGGYLVGFVASAASAGALCERGWDRRALTTFAAMLLSSVWVFGFGWLGLLRFVPGPIDALQAGVLPFLPGDLLKCALAAGLLPVVARRIPGRS